MKSSNFLKTFLVLSFISMNLKRLLRLLHVRMYIHKRIYRSFPFSSLRYSNLLGISLISYRHLEKTIHKSLIIFPNDLRTSIFFIIIYLITMKE